MKGVLWRVAKRLSYIQDARCLKVNLHRVYENQTGKGCMTQISVFYLDLIIMLTGPRSAIMTLYLGHSKIKHCERQISNG